MSSAMTTTPSPSGGSGGSQYKGRPLGRILIKMKKVNREQVHEALGIQKTKRGPIGQILIDLGYIDESDLQLALAAQIGMEPVALDQIDIGEDVIKRVPNQMANTYRIIPVEWDDATNTLGVVMASPDNFQATDDIRKLLGFNVKPMIATDDLITAALARYYPEGKGESINDLINEMAADDDLARFEGRGESIDLDDIKGLAENNQVKRLLNLILLQAIRDHASDIHFEPFEEEFKLRYRIDGVLYEMIPQPRHIAMAVASRIKVMSKLDIAERRLPQDGRISLTVGNNPIDLRVAVLPTMFGESVVLRVLDRGNVSLDIDKLGLRDDDMRTFKLVIDRPHGIVINTGPTGSGKTTTLYAALNTLNTVDVKILTAEDPVEYDIDGIIQCQINPEIGMTFARCLRSFLRQDPDIILVGEIRDLETAQIAIQASLTGHLVFSTLHTNDAPSAITRLIDMGIKPFLVASSIQAIMAQRLVRIICKECKAIDENPDPLLLKVCDFRPEQLVGAKFYKGRGCSHCHNTGYRGRKGLFEMMIMNSELRELAFNLAPITKIRKAAKASGMNSLLQDGQRKILSGMTTLEEVSKIAQAELTQEGAAA